MGVQIDKTTQHSTTSKERPSTETQKQNQRIKKTTFILKTMIYVASGVASKKLQPRSRSVPSVKAKSTWQSTWWILPPENEQDSIYKAIFFSQTP